MTDTKRHVTIIGAGIVGVSCAAFLQREGFDVTVVDKLEPGQGTSFGNAGSVSPSAILPVAMPGIMKKIPRWLLDPLGPLTVRWSYLPYVAPWLLQFIRHANRDEAVRVATAMRNLMGTVFDDYRTLLPAQDFAHLFRRNGCLYIYENQEELRAAKWSLDLRRDLGAEMVEVGGDEIRQFEPALNKRFDLGIYAPENGSTIDPYRLVNSIADVVKRNGGKFVTAEVRDVTLGDDGPVSLETSVGTLPVDKLVLAAGAWSSPLARKLGAKVPLETQRGYHVTFSNPRIEVHRTVMWNTRSVFVNPMEVGLRIAGTVELAGLKAAPNFARADKLADIARDMFPDLDTAEQSQWMGHRPCLPDSLPVVDRSPRYANTVFAFGHQHVGICSGGPTGKHVAALMADKIPEIDLAPFSANRF